MRNNRVFLPGEAIALGLVDEAAVESDAWTGPAVEVDDKTAPVIAEVVRGEVPPMTVRLVSPLLERYIAPGISAFTSANIPDMSDHDPESPCWVANHLLNSVLRAGYDLPMGAHIQHDLRRSEAALAEHARAREVTLLFLEEGGQSPTSYSTALLHWEYFLGQSWHAHLLLRQVVRLVTGDDSQNVFEPNDGSVEQRLCLLYNAMKHVESRIDAVQIPESPEMVRLRPRCRCDGEPTARI